MTDICVSGDIPIVSVMMMSYNSEEFIEDAIASVLSQSFQNFELCITDDNSTDGTWEIIQKWQKKFPEKIKINQNSVNLGHENLNKAANVGLRMCLGKYITVLDADEIMECDRLSFQVAHLENNPRHVAVSHEKTLITPSKEILPNNTKFRGRGMVFASDLILFGNIVSSCVMYRNNKNIFVDERLLVMGDWYLAIKNSIYGPIYVDSVSHTKKFIHDTNVTKTRSNAMAQDRNLTIKIFEDFAETRHVAQFRQDADLRQYINMLTRPLVLLWYILRYIKFRRYW